MEASLYERWCADQSPYERGFRSGMSAQTRRRAFRAWAPLALVVGLFAALAALAVDGGPSSPSAATTQGMNIDFGYTTNALTRGQTVHLCSLTGGTTAYAECHQPYNPGSRRPAVTSAILQGDLVASDCRRGASAFPAGQLKVIANNFDTQALSISVTADPHAPEVVNPCRYQGTLVVARADRSVVQMPLVVDLKDRWEPLVVYRVWFSLFLGACVGGLLKWLGDNIGKPVTKRALRSDEYRPFELVRNRAGLVLGLVTAVAVGLIGLRSQYVDNLSFGDSLEDYLTLVVWAFSGQLAGQTLIDIAGKVQPAVWGDKNKPGADAAETPTAAKLV